ncbi:MAG: L-rhamnose mutarotase [Bacteroidia bacterium]|nr:L-rhamnose mutarotase [Bacteroidia bacterium]
MEIVRSYPSPHKRFCLALDLKNDPALITEYLKYHSPEGFWNVIGEGIKKSGVEIMDIYNVDNRLFMICEMPVEIDFEEAWQKMGTYELQSDWASLMSTFQQALPGHTLEWVLMKRVYQNPE